MHVYTHVYVYLCSYASLSLSLPLYSSLSLSVSVSRGSARLGVASLVAELISPRKCTLLVLFPKSVKCIHSATKLLTLKLEGSLRPQVRFIGPKTEL